MNPTPDSSSSKDPMGEQELAVDPRKCVRCAAAAAIAPQLFNVGSRANQVIRQPQTEEERRLAKAAVLLCPSKAISFESERSSKQQDPNPPEPKDSRRS